jgi:hypothetical protein
MGLRGKHLRTVRELPLGDRFLLATDAYGAARQAAPLSKPQPESSCPALLAIMPLPAPRILLGAVALLLVCAVPMHAHAYSAQLFESSNCSPATVLVHGTKLKPGSCVAMGRGASSRVDRMRTAAAIAAPHA